jgi:hypothetical protein
MYNIRTDITRLKSAQKILNEKPSAQNSRPRILNEADRPWGEGNPDFDRGFEYGRALRGCLKSVFWHGQYTNSRGGKGLEHLVFVDR